MPSRIQKDIAFFSGVHFENQFMINLYECDISIIINTDDAREQRVALDRLVYFVTNHLQNSLIISSTEKEMITKYENAGLRLCIVPEEPYDQILGLVLLNKFNSIMEGKMEVMDMTFGSKLSDYVKFDLAKEEAESIFNQDSWYNDSSVSLRDTPKKKKDKVVKLFDPDEWTKNDLNWKEKKA